LLEDAAERSPESVIVAVLLGKAYGTAGYLEAAQHELSRAINMDPEAGSTHFMLALVLAQRERYGPCIEACKRTLELNPDHGAARRTKSQAEALLKQRHDETEECKAALRGDPGSEELRLRLSRLLGTVGAESERYAVLREGLTHSPESAALAEAAARLLATSWDPGVRDGPEAVRLARIAYGVGPPNDPQRLRTLALALAEAGHFDEALETGRKARSLFARAGDQHATHDMDRLLRRFNNGLAYHAAP
jgi:tetratricopeptide (TPR) repeat protein